MSAPKPLPLSEAAELVRLVGQRTPRWIINVRDGIPCVTALDSGNVIFSIHGDWTPDLIKLFSVLHPEALVALAELLWLIAGGSQTRIRGAADRLILAMDLEARHVPAPIKDGLG